MKTLLVGDLHLTGRIILPIVEEKIKELNCQRVILLGDYTDAWGQTSNVELYDAELTYLLDWKVKMVSKGIEVITLMGNHDAPYLIDEPRNYSVFNKTCFRQTGDKLWELGLQVAYKLDDYIVSHAGYAWGQEPEEWHFKCLSISDIAKISILEAHVGIARGGRYWVGSPIWADYELELKDQPNPHLLKQVVGHSPQLKISLDSSKISLDSSLVGIDTFTISRSFEFVGNGDLLLYDNCELSVVQTNWKTSENLKKIRTSFQVGNKT